MSSRCPHDPDPHICAWYDTSDLPHVGLGGPSRSMYGDERSGNVWAEHAAAYERLVALLQGLSSVQAPIQATVISVGPAWPCDHEHTDRGQLVEAEIVA